MFEIQFVESDDPILSLLTKEPWRVFDQDFGGYIFFLFGESDTDMATGFCRNLLSLDSLTSSYVAGIVLASRVRFRASVRIQYTTRPTKNIIRNRKEILLDDIHRVTELVDVHRRHRFMDSERELTAVTYGTDEFARQCGVSADLPCAIVVDGRQGGTAPACTISLTGPFDQTLRIIRRSVATLASSPTYEAFLASACELRKIESGVSDSLRESANQGSALVAKQSVMDRELSECRYRRHIAQGSRRALCAALQSRGVDAELVTSADEKFARYGSVMVRIARTLNALEYYRFNRAWPLCDEDKRRLEFIVVNHLAPLLRHDLCGAPVDQTELDLIYAELVGFQVQLVDIISGGLPTETDLVAKVQGEHSLNINEQLGRVSVANRRLLADADRARRAVARIAAAGVPSFAEAFGRAAECEGVSVSWASVDRRGFLSFAAPHLSQLPRRTLKKGLGGVWESVQYDVFLCHNTADKPAVVELSSTLAMHGLRPWLDKDDLVAGGDWVLGVQEGINLARCGVVVIGPSGIGPWQQMEISALLYRFVQHGIPLIPVLLADAPRSSEMPLFLRCLDAIDLGDEGAIGQLVRTITGLG